MSGKCTSNEISQIIEFLEGKKVKEGHGLSVMKEMKSVECVKRKGKVLYYLVSDDETWEYFYGKYKHIIDNKRIKDIDRLKYEASVYGVGY